MTDEAVLCQVLQLQFTQILLDGVAVLGVHVDVLTFNFIRRLPRQEEGWMRVLEVGKNRVLVNSIRGRDNSGADNGAVSVVKIALINLHVLRLFILHGSTIRRAWFAGILLVVGDDFSWLVI